MQRVLIDSTGRVLDPDRPLLHADDLGVLHGDGLFETMLVRAGKACGLARHLRRLAQSAAPAGLPPVDVDQVAHLVQVATGEWTSSDEGALRVIYTAGREGASSPTLYVTISDVPARVATARRDGVRAVSLPSPYQAVPYQAGSDQLAPWLLSGVKSLSYASNVAALRHVRSLGMDDAIFLTRDGTVLEGPRSSVVAVIDGALVTPRRDGGILPGTTQEAVFELAARRGLAAYERTLRVEELYDADAVWLLSSLTLAARVCELDGQILGGMTVVDVAELADQSAGS